MINIYKNSFSQIALQSCSQIEKNSWIQLTDPSTQEIEEVASHTGIPSSLILQVLVEKELPRIKQVDQALLIVMDVPYMKDKSVKNKYVTYPLGVILYDQSYVVTVSLRRHQFLEQFVQGKVEDFYTEKQARFFIQIVLKFAEEYLDTLGLIDEDIQKMEKSTYHSTNNRELIHFLNMQKTLVYFITSLQANSFVLDKIRSDEILSLDRDDKMLLEDAIIENKQCIETSIVYRDILDSTMDTYGTIISNNLNVIMKFLAGITIVFSIPTMISSFLGMNVPLGVVGESEFSFLIICIISCILSFIIACWLKNKNML